MRTSLTPFALSPQGRLYADLITHALAAAVTLLIAALVMWLNLPGGS